MSTTASSRRGGTVSVLDIGTSKICCMIARWEPSETGTRPASIEVIGVGHQRSRGVRNGTITDLAKAEDAIRRAVDAAEEKAGVAVGSLIVNVSSATLASRTERATIALNGDEVASTHVDRVLGDATRAARSRDEKVLHSLPIEFAIDDTPEIDDPIGMVGDELSVACHFVHTARGPLRNLERAVNRAHLEVERMVATPYASALSATVDDEAEMGCVAIDLGAGTTSWAILSGGRFLYGDTVAVGGQHITTDLARGLSIGIEEAERLKVLEVDVAPMVAGDELVNVAPLAAHGSAAVAAVPRTLVTQIASARVEETFELVRDRIRKSGFGRHADRRVILTGGGAQLTGIADLARKMLARNVRVGRPVGVRGLAPQHKTPAFSTALGLVAYPQAADRERHVRSLFALPTSGRLARVGRWFRDF